MEDDSATDSSPYTSSTDDTASEYESTDSESDPDEEPKPVLVAPIPWKPRIKRSYKWDTQDSYRRMEDSLAGIVRPVDIPYQRRPYVERKPVEAPAIEIAGISSIGMHYNLR
jgi:hypothetical protein